MIKQSSAELAYQQIKELIINQKLLPGQKLIEMDMSKYCGVSRTPIREAIRLLEKDGIVEIVPKKGAFIKSMTKSDVVMVYEVDSALEGLAAYICAEKYKNNLIDDYDIQKIKTSLERMEELELKGLIKDWVHEDENFHNIIITISGNKFIAEQRKQILSLLNQVLWFVTPVMIDKKVSNIDHHLIFEAISNGNCENARNYAQYHRMRTRNIIKEQFK